jgi:hypothetical protein
MVFVQPHIPHLNGLPHLMPIRPKLFQKIWPNNYMGSWCKVSKIMRAIDLISKKESKVSETLELSME